MGLVLKVVGWILALVLLAMFPWLLLPVLLYWAWKRGILAGAARRLSSRIRKEGLLGGVAAIDASVSGGMMAEELVISYEAPSEESHYIVVQRGGERRILMASSLTEEGGTPENYGQVVAAVMALLGDLSWSITFAFFLSGGGEVGGLIAFDRPAPASGRDPGAVCREAMGQIEAVRKAVVSVAPSVTVRSLRGSELAPLALWGASR